ncbi:MAG: trypsin-like peptidase domain-containing protein [Lachnospiraceae bacterium]|nr:trypsin-like peptidase domain-containing protein [Lachnospiraceae bacterium]
MDESLNQGSRNNTSYSNATWDFSNGNGGNGVKRKEHKKKSKGQHRFLLGFVCGALVFAIGVFSALGFSGAFSRMRNGGTDGTAIKATAVTTSSSDEGKSNVSQVTKNVMPSVVSITNMSIQEVQNFFGQSQEQKSKSVGSGFIIAKNDSELLIATNNHVVEGSDELTVTFVDGKSVKASVKGTDSNRDLAVVAVKLSNIKSDTLKEIKVATLGDSSKLQVGETAIAIGNALGYGQSVTEGIISAKDRTLENYNGNLIQTDAAINPGNSGGPLVDANGTVIGINSAKIATDEVEGMGYSIPINEASKIFDKLMNQVTREKVSAANQGYLGITGADVNEEAAQMYNMPVGVYVSSVANGSGSEKAGLKKGDIITGLEGSTITNMASLQEQLTYYKKGEKVKLTIQSTSGSNGQYEKSTITVKLGAKTE